MREPALRPRAARPSPTPTSGVGSFVLWVGFGAQVSVGASASACGPARAPGGASARRGESGLRAPADSFLPPGRARNLQCKVSPPPSALVCPEIRKHSGPHPPQPSVSPLPLRRRSSEGEVLQSRTNKRWSCTGLKKSGGAGG